MRRARIATPFVAAVAITLGLAGAAAGGNGNGHGHGQGKDHKAPAAPVADPGGVIDLPPGYSYDVLARDCVDQVTSTESGATFQMPSDFDANITVRGKGGTVQLLSAHELTKPVPGDFQGDAAKCHVEEQATTDDGDSDGWGSVSRLTLGKDGTTVTKRELITTGIHDLCAGAKTKWGTFLVNEEFPFVADPQSRSGWVWEIDPATGAEKRATGMGRFSHEQEALSGKAWYLTDDRGNNQYLYKFVPDKRRDLSAGKLYGLKFDRSTNTGEWIGPLDPMRPEADMAARVGPPTAANSFNKHEGMVKAKHGEGVVFSESAAGADPGRVWRLVDRGDGVHGTVLAEGDFSKMSRPDNIRYDREGNLFIFEDNGSALDTNPATGGNNEVYVLPKGMTGSENLRKFATVRGGGEGTGPWFSTDGKLLYLSIQDQAQPDGSDSRVLAIHIPKGHGGQRR
jgi:uncharacterized protein DUF839